MHKHMHVHTKIGIYILRYSLMYVLPNISVLSSFTSVYTGQEEKQQMSNGLQVTSQMHTHHLQLYESFLQLSAINQTAYQNL